MSKNNKNNWQFEGPLQLLKQRAFLLSEIRRFFDLRQVLEVDTPILSSSGNTDVQIDMFSSQALLNDQKSSYLRTSPEFFHKRLLSSGSGDVFEIAKVFRSGERTRLHSPEFTLLEWYRVDFKLSDLMSEVTELIHHLLQQLGGETLTVEVITYQTLFKQCVDLDPFVMSDQELHDFCVEHGYSGSVLSRTESLDFIFSLMVQPQLEDNDQYPPGLMIHDFPIEMAALAERHPLYPDRCLRFEFLWNGVELANGYQELTDAQEQKMRFIADNMRRKQLGKPELPIDQHLLAALTHGMPGCSGVALGIERLMMCLWGHDSIDAVMGFRSENS